MKMSDHGLTLLKSWEGFKRTMYIDSAGYPTIGVGHLITKAESASGEIMIDRVPVHYASGLTDNQVTSLLKQDLSDREREVNILIKATLTQNQFDAVMALVFNIGEGAFASSHVLQYINSGQLSLVPDAFRMWNKCHGEVMPGLVNRREHEIKLWSGQL